MINGHFQEELSLMKKVFENDEQVENIGFQVFKLMVKQDRERELQTKDQKESPGTTVELTTEKIETNKALAQNYFAKK
jgi:hypothetical protein